MHSKIFSATTIGVDAHIVEVEVDVSFGLVSFYIVGLPDTAIKESSKRIQTALKNCGFRLPAKRITVNLAPADLKKEGTLFDLPIAIGILQSCEYISIDSLFLHETLFLGELSLDGAVRPIKGALAIAYDAIKLGKKRIIVPLENAQEAALIQEVEVIGIQTLPELVAYLRKEIIIQPTPCTFKPHAVHIKKEFLDFSQVKGQRQAKRALQIAAAGRHNILFIGPPGAGKTMLAKRLATIIPTMTLSEILETSRVYSISGKLHSHTLIYDRPFRAPHHTISQAGLVGGGTYPQPGEISLAHNGILFLDELTEFKRDTIEALRQPLENRQVSISRVHQTVTFPASIQLIVALNPCPCGFYGDKQRPCSCSSQQIHKYLSKLSGPLLDRIDLQIHVQSIEYDTIAQQNKEPELSSHELQVAIDNALAMQKNRFSDSNVYNSAMGSDAIDIHCQLTSAAQEIMKKAFSRLKLSMRGYHKIIKVARTIADLEESQIIDVSHVQEAIMYRSLDHYLDQQRQ